MTSEPTPHGHPVEALTSMECGGYRAFDQPTSIELRRLNVIFGRNNTGKTTLARLPLFAAASVAESPDLYALATRGIRFGSSFRSLASAHQPHPRIRFGMTWSDRDGNRRRLALDLQHLITSGREQMVVPTAVEVDERRLPFPLEASGPEQTALSGRERLTELLDDAPRLRFEANVARLGDLLAGTIHVSSTRPPIEEIYPSRDPEQWSAAETAFILARHDDLLTQVGAWFESKLDHAAPEVEHGTFAFRLVMSSRQGGTSGDLVNLAEAGRGTQSVLPVAALLTAVDSGLCQPQLMIVEEPEARLHPSAHGAVADLLISAARRTQLVVETHSENLILRLRRRIAEGVLKKDDLGLYYIEPDYRVRRIEIEETGAAADWPTGVFEYDVEEAQAIVQARLSSIGNPRSR